MKEKTFIREKLINDSDYTPYCGNDISRSEKNGCDNPRTFFNGKQFICPHCGWTSDFPNDFIERYKIKWGK